MSGRDATDSTDSRSSPSEPPTIVVPLPADDDDDDGGARGSSGSGGSSSSSSSFRVVGFNPRAYSFRPSSGNDGQVVVPGVDGCGGGWRASPGLGGHGRGYEGRSWVDQTAPSFAPGEVGGLRAGGSGITNPRGPAPSLGGHGNGRGRAGAARYATKVHGSNDQGDTDPEHTHPAGGGGGRGGGGCQAPPDPPPGSATVRMLLMPRIFYPFTLKMPHPPILENLTRYHAPSNATHTLFRTSRDRLAETHMDAQTIVISCYSLGARAIGIFFGDDSRHNHRECLMYEPHNVSPLAAQAFAVLKAVKLGRRFANVVGPSRDVVMKVVVATCSEWVVKAVTEYLGKWKEERWGEEEEGAEATTADERYFRGARENRQAWERLDRCVEGAVDDGLEVEFWLVRKEDLAGAQALAQLAVREYTFLRDRVLRGEQEEEEYEGEGNSEDADDVDAEEAP